MIKISITGGIASGKTTAANYCKKKNILFLSTPYDKTSVDFLESINILSTGSDTFNKKLLIDLKANKEICNGYIEGSLAMSTSLVPAIGYDKAAEIAYKAYKQNKTVREIALEEDILSKEEIEKLLDHKNMIKSKK